MRVEPKVLKAVNMLVGELQLETGESVSVSEALWSFIKEYRPDIAEKAEKTGNGNGDKTPHPDEG